MNFLYRKILIRCFDRQKLKIYRILWQFLSIFTKRLKFRTEQDFHQHFKVCFSMQKKFNQTLQKVKIFQSTTLQQIFLQYTSRLWYSQKWNLLICQNLLTIKNASQSNLNPYFSSRPRWIQFRKTGTETQILGTRVYGIQLCGTISEAYEITDSVPGTEFLVSCLPL